MADDKKYYYLKLKENFFDTDEMIVLQNMPDGYLYSDILMKIYLRSLKTEGKLMFKDRIPYNSTILAQVVRHNVGVTEKALSLFKDLELIEILDNGAIYLLDIQNYIGQSSSEADRKRDYRKNIEEEKRRLLPEGQKSGQMSVKCPDKNPPEIEIEIEKDIDLEKEIKREQKKISSASSKPQKRKFGEYGNVFLTLEELEKLQNSYHNTDELIKHLDEYIEMKGYKAKSHYLVIIKWVVNAVEEQKSRGKKSVNTKETGNPFTELRKEMGFL